MPYNFKNTLRLPKEEEEIQTYAEIEEGVYFRGHNLWLLVLSMGIACVGLNINSPAAVIGAMLISPLMGPVVGLAFEKDRKKYLDITILNDSSFIPKNELAQHDLLVKDINLIWHYSKATGDNNQIKYLQNQINALRLQIENQKNQNIRIEKGKK